MNFYPSTAYGPLDNSSISNSQVARANPVARSISPLQTKLGREQLNTSQSRISNNPAYGFNNYAPPPSTLRLNGTPFKSSSITESQQSLSHSIIGGLVAPDGFKFKDLNESIASKQYSQMSLADSSQKMSRYSPLRRQYGDSKSPSVISHLNTSINDQLRQTIAADKQVNKFALAFKQLTEANDAKLTEFMVGLKARLSKLSDAGQRSLLERLEGEKLREDMKFYGKKAEMAARWTAEVRKKLEDREMIFRALNKQALSKKPISEYLNKKAQEIEADNERDKNAYNRKVEMLTSELRDAERLIESLDVQIKAKENEWVIRDHQHTVALEHEARDEMNKRSYEIVMKHFKDHQAKPAFAKPYQQLSELLNIRNFYEKQYEEVKFFSNEAELRQEIARLEKIKSEKESASKYDYHYLPRSKNFY